MRVKHESDRLPRSQEDVAVEAYADPLVAEHKEEMHKRGANQQGEGRHP
jgi:hypothetical protein